MFSVLSIFPLSYRIIILSMTWLCTVIIPQLLIAIYHKSMGWKYFHFAGKEKRYVPYIISIISYSGCYWLLTLMNAVHTIKAVLIAALVVQIICAIINVRWKISTHTAAIGSFLGGLIAFSIIFYFNPIWWFCIINLVGGVVGTCRMILRQHTLGEVIGGYCVGFMGALITILLW